MQTTSTQGNRQLEAGDRIPSLHPVVALDATTPAPATRGAANPAGRPDPHENPYDAPGGSDVMIVGPDMRMLEVHYSLDQVANAWVANILDRETGEIVRTVPATRVLHQLAELAEHGPGTHVDARA